MEDPPNPFELLMMAQLAAKLPAGMPRPGLEEVRRIIAEMPERTRPENYGRQRSKAQMLADHDASHVEIKKVLRESLGVIQFNNIKLAQKPRPAHGVALSDCTPISIADLVVGTTHKGRLLRVTVLRPFNAITGMHTVIEDEYGKARFSHKKMVISSRRVRREAPALRSACSACTTSHPMASALSRKHARLRSFCLAKAATS